MSRGKAHSEDTTNAVMMALLAGQGVGEVAAQYNLSRSAIYRIKADIDAGNVQVSGKSPQLGKLGKVDTTENPIPDSLFSDYLCSALKALKVHADVAADEAYLRRYPPQQLALLHGIIADKAARIIEAISGASRSEEGQISSEEPEAEDAD